MPASRSSAKPRSRARDLLAENLLAFRRLRGWSQEELAHEAGLHRTFVAHVERRVRNIALDNVEKLAQALDVEVHELLMPRARAA
jgi:transcriptional regulator with XRE-family HTH domain